MLRNPLIYSTLIEVVGLLIAAGDVFGWNVCIEKAVDRRLAEMKLSPSFFRRLFAYTKEITFFESSDSDILSILSRVVFGIVAVGGGMWSGLVFWLILFPNWVSTISDTFGGFAVLLLLSLIPGALIIFLILYLASLIMACALFGLTALLHLMNRAKAGFVAGMGFFIAVVGMGLKFV